MLPVVGAPGDDQHSLVPDDLGADLEAKTLQSEADLDGVGAGVPDVGLCKLGTWAKASDQSTRVSLEIVLAEWPSIM